LKIKWKRKILKKKNLFFIKFLFFFFEILLLSLLMKNQLLKIVNIFNKEIKVSLCTMGKQENLYVKEFVEYYIKLGIDHIFIYDDNDQNTEKISNVLGTKYINKVTIYEALKYSIHNQKEAYTNCYHNNLNKYDWFLMVDMDEFLYIVNNTLKNYLTNQVFNKCDFIKINWVFPNDNNLINYDPRPLFKRFRGPYMKSRYIKSIIRGNIQDLKYSIHSPFFSPKKNITCNNEGKIIIYKNINFVSLKPINIKKAYIIHYRFKSTEEFVNKYKRGYKNWFGKKKKNVIKELLNEYFTVNKITNQKIYYIEKALKLNLSKYYSNKLNK